MRKYQQKQMLDLITTLYEVTDEISKQFSKKNFSTVVNLLGDCQDAAVYIGEFIGNLEIEDTRTVELLTGYHTSLYNIAVQIETVNASFIKQLKKELWMIENSIKNVLKPSKIEVVFFPYKASMWDALESIWLAAQADPQCDAYVVPIPYYDRLPDGRFGQIQYDGNQYPDYVPIVDWQDYNIEERRPDVSFIHNGYDEFNRITVVHPNYFSKNLKKHTGLLCYSPYFVSPNNNVDEHLCTVEGVVYSDRVFVQSNEVRNGYIRAIQAFEKEHNCAGRFGNVKEKIVASGSPKFDKVINSKREDFKLPDQWKKRIEKSDGSWKKVVLYNTSIGPILNGDDKYIAKLRTVLGTFRNRDDVTLWWRPHPLSVATYGSMRPVFYDEYTQLIKEYQSEGYGIYDDTADLHRALSVSSAFYGDGTSLMQMYQCLRKPVMIQNVDMSDLPLQVGSLCDTEEYLWFLTLHFNGFFRLNKKTWDVEYIGSFDNEKVFDWRVYHTIHHSGNKLYFSPHSAAAIAIYDLTSESFEYVELPLPKDKKYNDQSKFSKIIEAEGSLYFIPLQYPGIVKLNMEDNSTEIIDNWVKPVQTICDSVLGYFSNGVYNEAKSSLTLAFSNANAVMEIDLHTNAVKLNPISGDKCGYTDIMLIDGIYWLVGLKKSTLVRFNPDDNTMSEYLIDLDEIPVDGFGLFQKMVHYKKNIYLVPAEQHQMVKFNLGDHSFSYADDFCLNILQGDSISESSQNGYFYVSSNALDKIYLTDKQSNQFIEFDPQSGSLRKEDITITEGLSNFLDFLAKGIEHELHDANSCALLEDSHIFTLEKFLDMISQPVLEPWLEQRLDKQVELRCAEILHPDGKAGIEIYEKSKKAVLNS